MVNHWGGGHRFIDAVRGWKVLLAVGTVAVTWCLASVLPWWLAGTLVLGAVLFDAGQGGWSNGMIGHLDIIFSEGLSYAFTLLLIAAICAYLKKPGWGFGLAIAALVNVLLLARPACVSFVSVFAVLWLIEARQRDWFRGLRRPAALAGLTLAGIAIHCSANYVTFGHFRQHPFTGFNLVTTALQLAEQEDAEAFDDPQMKRFVRTCTVDYAAQRSRTFNYEAACANCWLIAVPVFRDVYGQDVETDWYFADDVLMSVNRMLIRRHPGEFLTLAWHSFVDGFWNGWLHVPLIAVLIAAGVRFVRRGEGVDLAIAYFAALPFLCIIPACFTNYPFERYRSATYLLEVGTLPLFLAVQACRAWAARRAVISLGSRETNPRTSPRLIQSTSPA